MKLRIIYQILCFITGWGILVFKPEHIPTALMLFVGALILASIEEISVELKEEIKK